MPKIQRPEYKISGLCSVLYKVITKVVANRLKALLPKLIKPYQASFIAGRSIEVSRIITQEVIHSMRIKKGSKLRAIKVDLQKFDRLRWDFIRDTLYDAGLPASLCNIIMHCTTSPSLQVLWNGRPTDEFKPSRGIRQVKVIPYRPIFSYSAWNGCRKLSPVWLKA